MELEISIAPDGGLTLHIKGVKGKACEETVELFKRLVGPKTAGTLTPEYYEPEAHARIDVRRP